MVCGSLADLTAVVTACNPPKCDANAPHLGGVKDYLAFAVHTAIEEFGDDVVVQMRKSRPEPANQLLSKVMIGV